MACRSARQTRAHLSFLPSLYLYCFISFFLAPVSSQAVSEATTGTCATNFPCGVGPTLRAEYASVQCASETCSVGECCVSTTNMCTLPPLDIRYATSGCLGKRTAPSCVLKCAKNCVGSPSPSCAVNDGTFNITGECIATCSGFVCTDGEKLRASPEKILCEHVNCTLEECCAASHNSGGASGILLGETPLDNAVTLLIIQLFVIIGISRVIFFIVKFLRQPRVVAEIIGGVVLGPSAMGRIPKFLDTIFPTASMPILNTVANIGLIFFLFLVGLELDPSSLRQTGKQAIFIAAAGMIFPFALGIPAAYAIYTITGDDATSFGTYLLFMGVALSITAFPVLARILSEMKLITTAVGQITMSAAAVNDAVAWVLLALTIALLNAGSSPLNSLYIFIMGAGFVFVMFMIVRRLVFTAVQRFSGCGLF